MAVRDNGAKTVAVRGNDVKAVAVRGNDAKAVAVGGNEDSLTALSIRMISDPILWYWVYIRPNCN